MPRLVAHVWAYVAAAALLASCATYDNAPDMCARFAVSDTASSLVVTPSRPVQVALFHQLASQTPAYAFTAANNTRELWLQAPTGVVVMCKVKDEHALDACRGEWWRFEQVNSVWRVVAHSDWGCHPGMRRLTTRSSGR